MNIDPIRNGIVIDHIKAGLGMELYHFLALDKLSCSVAIIKNVNSSKMGKKDIIKIDEAIDLNLDVLGYIDPDITVNFIKNGERIKKCHPGLPDKVVGVIKCKNPRCITGSEPELPQIFKLCDKEKRIYRCAYCEASAPKKNE